MLTPPKFLIGTLASGERRWAAIDVNLHHIDSAIGETRFGGYLKPFPSEEAARAALTAAGAVNIEAEAGRRDRRRNGRR